VNRDLLNSPTDEFISTHGVGWIPVSRGFNVLLVVSLGTSVDEFAIRVSRLLRRPLFLQGHLKTIMRHGAVLPREELQDHVLPTRIDTRHPAAATELGDLENLSVHVFQER